LAARNKKAAAPNSAIAARCFQIVQKRTRDRAVRENVQGRDVGSLADSAASGHKSQVRSILLRRWGRYKQTFEIPRSFFTTGTHRQAAVFRYGGLP
jgi:hypothetical protein